MFTPQFWEKLLSFTGLDLAKWLGFLVGAGPELPDHRRAFLDHGRGPAAFWHRPDAKLMKKPRSSPKARKQRHFFI
jgi:hypothetical protein